MRTNIKLMIGERESDHLGLNESQARKKLLEIRGFLDTGCGYSVSERIQPFKIVRLGERCVRGNSAVENLVRPGWSNSLHEPLEHLLPRSELMDEANARNRWRLGAAE
jgi:hypothetical protein